MTSGKNLKEYLEDPLSDWSIQDLEAWDDKIIDVAKKYQLDWFPINYEICDYIIIISVIII